MTQLAWAIVALSLTTLVACAAPDGDALVLDVHDDGHGALQVRATADDLEILIEWRRGRVRPESWIGDARREGRFEGDTLVADSQGRLLLLELGGDAAVDSTWMQRLSEPHGLIDPEQRRRELQLAVTVGERLGDGPVLDLEARRLARDLAVSARATLADFDDGARVVQDAHTVIDADASIGEGPAVVEQALAAPTYTHQIYIRWAACCWNFGEHAATRLRIFNASGQLVTELKTNNHGRAVDDPSMTTAQGCPKSWSGRSNQLPPFQPFRTADTAEPGNAGGCSTRYDDLPPTAGGHVCNDDAIAQYANVKFNASMLWGTCSDATLRVRHPTCN
jgi:hypothetical protein